ncbi:flavin reductase family protein [Desulfolucanica intricata]|uniref:flavin reductase family protein n=1 Tax=Desulfolucanica intricata TaxID=1285191 RepID=UPI0008369462|nr:flavin reductase family protein [Desulfolucanica intricata]
MIKNIKYNEYTKELLERLPKGVFLTVRDKEKLNTMTIGWGTVGYIWQKPIFVVSLRYSRYTYQLIEKAKEFTVSIPLNNDLNKALSICGTKSGKDINKFTECNLSADPGQVVSTPVIGECDLFYECKVVYQQAMEPALAAESIHKSCYSKGDFHVLYYGEIVASYIKE